MTDRIPTYPGRVTLTPVSGQANAFDMVMADVPTTAGTPPTKANLLADATSQTIFSESSDHTVNEALYALVQRTPKVGDTITTWRTMSSNWGLCNGAYLDPSAYSALAALSNTQFKYPPKLQLTSSQSAARPAVASNGTYSVVAYVNISGYPCVRRSSDGGVTWGSEIALESSYACYGNRIKIKYVNGNFVVLVSPTTATSQVLYYSADGATWSSHSATFAPGTYPVDIAYGNGYYVILFLGSGSSVFTYSTTALNGTLTYKLQFSSSSSVFPTSIDYINNKFVFVFTNAATYLFYTGVSATADPTGTWTVTAVISSAGYCGNLVYANGYYCVIISGPTLTISTSSLYYSTNLTSWSSQTLNSSYYTLPYCMNLWYLDRHFMWGNGNGELWEVDTPNHTPVMVNSGAGGIYTWIDYNSTSTSFVAIGTTGTTTQEIYYGKSRKGQILLPTESVSGEYVYKKLLEGA